MPDRTIPPGRTPAVETTPGARWGDHPPPTHLLAVAAGGVLGTALRYLFVLAFPTPPGGFPWTTFAENVLGAFLLGIVLVGLLRASGWGRDWRPFLATGVLGSFTTFSNFSVEIYRLGEGGSLDLALLYATGSTGAGLVAAFAGIGAGAAVMRRVG